MQLEIRQLSVSSRTGNLVHGVDLTLKSGQTLALVGVSGSGKSLTCSSVFDLLPAGLSQSGEMLLNGEAVAAASLRGRRVSCIMQNPASAFNPLQTMRKHGIETMQASGAGYDEYLLTEAMLDAGLESCHSVLDLYPFQMSGGMLQRMMIALALVSKAPFLIADEPTTDLDLVVQSHILDRIEAINRERNLGVLLVTHDFGVVARLADQVAVMSEGRIVECGSVGEIFHQPQHAATRSLLNAHLSLYREFGYG
ncbi:ATP-binding cassette domain-containing protein [Vibrio sp. JC009]|uniref:ATP-binding cassette domain-containing protein n=1 Tax=Vibrio sp. JC009 TaxID=2912314 RepID=UPI0023AEE843|nr:ATP-binding cassette domain-containing protein [Vibrio sp. JC009]WED21702.1 ATP-binding cassette domain-containing protein [Vibrio sp. JC009]